MGCCTFINRREMTKEGFDILVPSSNDSIQSISDKNRNYLSTFNLNNKEDVYNLAIFPSILIKSKENLNGLVIVKMKNF